MRPGTMFVLSLVLFLFFGTPNFMVTLLWDISYLSTVGLPFVLNSTLMVVFLIVLALPSLTYCGVTISGQRYTTALPLATVSICSTMSSLYAIALVNQIGTSTFGLSDQPMLLTTQLLTTALTVVGAFACASMMRQACADDLDKTGVPA